MRNLLIATVAVASLAVVPAVASAQSPDPASPSAGKLDIKLSGVYRSGKERIAFVGTKIGIRGVVDPAVAGEKVTVTVKRGKKVLREREVAVDGDGFKTDFSSRKRGSITVTATHAATPAQVEMSAKPLKIDLVRPSAHHGGRGAVVRFIQTRLGALHYLVPQSGRYDDGTGRALLAYRKVNRMARNQSAGKKVILKLAAGRGGFRPRHGGPRHVEADLSRQVINLINADGKVYKTLVTSSGKPSTPTVLGTFHFYSKTRGTNAKGMLDSNYFIRGYAIHGYPEVPTYAASHGCLRIPNANAAFVYGWVRIGDRIDVYR